MVRKKCYWLKMATKNLRLAYPKTKTSPRITWMIMMQMGIKSTLSLTGDMNKVLPKSMIRAALAL